MQKYRRILYFTLAAAMILFGAGLPYAVAESARAVIAYEEGRVVLEGDGAVVEGTIATITAPGIYRLSGACDQGQLVVDCDGDVTLLLENLSLTSADGPAIDIREAEKVTLLLPEGTRSTLTDAAAYAGAASGGDAAVFSKADLVIGGEGALTVNGRYNDGIASRDTLLIEGGSIAVNAKNHGVKGKDYLIIRDGSLEVVAGGDALKATNAEQPALGYVQIDGGFVSLTAQDDGISAISHITVNGGQISIDTANNGMKSEGALTIAAGKISIFTDDDDFVSQTKSISTVADVTVRGRDR